MKKILFSVVTLVVMLVPFSPARAYQYAGYRWAGTYPTVAMDTTKLYLTSWRNVATDAMNNWNNTGSRWAIVNYAPSNNTMSLYYETGTSVLAYTRTYRTGIFWGDVYRGTITVNNAQNFNPPYTSGCWYDLRSVIRHEMGHLLVLNHEDRFWTLMNSTIGCGEVKNITNDEWTAIRNIYGVR